jgi:broad specificity phosphatase PhoE
LADIAALRFVIAAGVHRLLLVVHGETHADAVEVLSGIDWEDTSVVLADSGEVLAHAGQH